jgi:heme/copper-type cytochrome/quinol oxidase subunit 1
MHTALLVVLILSGVLVVGGVVLVAVSSQTPASFGWFAYQPMSGSLFAPGGFVVLTQPAIVGAFVAGVGVVGLSAATGFMVGRRVRAGG